MRSIEIPQPADRNTVYRALEILPGALSWTILALPAILSIISPQAAAYFIITYILAWFVRTMGQNVRLYQGWRMMSRQKKLPWRSLNRDLEKLTVETTKPPRWHVKNLERVQRHMGLRRVKPSEVYHAVIVAFWNESPYVLRPTIESVAASDYDLKKIILLIAYEERGGPAAAALADSLIKDYGQVFYHAEAIMHPHGIPGEVIGKGGNITYAGRRLKTFLQAEAIDPAKVLVTTLDADNHPDKRYLSALTYTFCSTEEPKYVSYQPITMYLNNIWDAPAPMRVVATGNSFWAVTLSLRQHALRNFSSHSQPLSALIETDFWSTRTIVEDGHQYWRTFFRFDGKHEVYPIFVPIYQDAVLTHSYRRTLKMQFIQVRRWTWGASDVAYVAYNGFCKKNRIPKHILIGRFLRLLESHVSWATMPLLLLLAALVPFLLNPQSYLSNQLPQLARQLNTIAATGILVSLYLGMKTLPPKPERYKKRRTFWMVIQWIYLPLVTIIYGSFAAIYSQTRLMFGWYLGFVITEKAVKK